MTDKPTPTDAELFEVIREAARGGAVRRDGSTSLRIARAVLAKWGQPVVAGDVDRADAVNLARNALTQYDCAITKKGVRVLAEAVLSMDSALTTPQPTQAQAGAVPLAHGVLADLLDAAWEDFPNHADTKVHFAEFLARRIEAAHGFKEGGQHG